MDEHDSKASAGCVDLHQLPVFTPDAALWPRVLAGQRRRRHVQRVQRFGACVGAMIFACAAIVLLPHPLQPLQPLQQQIAAGQRESQALESQWLRVAGSMPAATSNLTRVRIIDADLQAAYDRGAAAQDIAPLWRQRNEVLRGLIAHVRDTNTDAAPMVTRI